MRFWITLCIACAAAAANGQSIASTPPPAPALAAAVAAEEAAIVRPELADYRGWLKFLRFEAETAVARHGAASSQAADKIGRLDEWTRRISADPHLLDTLRGVQEWAYESPADGSGQPFKLVIPTDYDPARPAPLAVSLHGYSGDHLKYTTGMVAHPGSFEVAVLGRAREGWYVGLGEADVLHVIDYIRKRWRIDPDRVHIMGTSMGGDGVLKFGSRRPHLFASGRILCGFLDQEAIGNLRTLPIYATHSDDDPVVPVIFSRGPLADLRNRGGIAIFDETTGLGHSAWDYTAGNARGEAWEKRQVRPSSKSIRRLDFTAMDHGARRCWWAEVAEWGPLSKPARFIATAGPDNTLFVELTNVGRLRLLLSESPFDSAKPLHVVVNGRIPFDVPAPLPAETMIGPGAIPVPVPSPEPSRLHTPGGPLLVYDGSPLLIVYGTHGDAASVTALRAAAEAASCRAGPRWATPGGEPDPGDGVPHPLNLYGNLPIKPDTAVVDSDLTSANLVLIGTAAENSVVARLADRLPVRMAAGHITCSDGYELPAAGASLGLVAQNPLDQQRLVYWVASSVAEGYKPGSAVNALAAPHFIGADLIVTHAVEEQLVATRSFDSRWGWAPGRGESPVVSRKTESNLALARRMAEALRLATGSDFALARRLAWLGEVPAIPRETRVCDLAALHYGEPIIVVELTGAELLEAQDKASKISNTSNNWLGIQPEVSKAAVDPLRRYRMAVPVWSIFTYADMLKLRPKSQWLAETTVPEALERFLSTDSNH